MILLPGKMNLVPSKLCGELKLIYFVFLTFICLMFMFGLNTVFTEKGSLLATVESFLKLSSWLFSSRQFKFYKFWISFVFKACDDFRCLTMFWFRARETLFFICLRVPTTFAIKSSWGLHMSLGYCSADSAEFYLDRTGGQNYWTLREDKARRLILSFFIFKTSLSVC
mgnify:FL=1